MFLPHVDTSHQFLESLKQISVSKTQLCMLCLCQQATHHNIDCRLQFFDKIAMSGTSHKYHKYKYMEDHVMRLNKVDIVLGAP